MIGSARQTLFSQPTYYKRWACSITVQSNALSRMCTMGYSLWCVSLHRSFGLPLTAPLDDPSERLRR